VTSSVWRRTLIIGSTIVLAAIPAMLRADALPQHALTPGAVITRDRGVVCARGYAGVAVDGAVAGAAQRSAVPRRSPATRVGQFTRDDADVRFVAERDDLSGTDLHGSSVPRTADAYSPPEVFEQTLRSISASLEARRNNSAWIRGDGDRVVLVDHVARSDRTRRHGATLGGGARRCDNASRARRRPA